MSDERRMRMYSKKATGTVPKAKLRNNGGGGGDIGSTTNREVCLSNSFQNVDKGGGREYYHQQALKLNSQRNFTVMDNTQDSSAFKQNGTRTPSSSSASTSRRNSTSTALINKTENVAAKFPDRKNIEDRLMKIREYLNATSSLISNMKSGSHSSDEEQENFLQMYKDLKDSEVKLTSMLEAIDAQDQENKVSENGLETLDKAELERRYEEANREVQSLQEQESLLLNLQLAAENQLRDARQAHYNLSNQMMKTSNKSQKQQQQQQQQQQDVNNERMREDNAGGGYLDSVRLLDEQIKNLEEKSKVQPGKEKENMIAHMDNLQQQIGVLRESNENRNHLIEILDNRDTALKLEHIELQGRLLELQNKKNQVDQLASQLQLMNEESEDEDVGMQVRKIVTMKNQLSKLKDMLEAVKDSQIEENARALPQKNANENSSNRSTNVRKEKQVNKSSIKANEREKLKLQEELHAKKRELEELMCKHKAVSSNLNQDVHPDNKTENFSDFESWRPVSNTVTLPSSEEDDNEEEEDEDYRPVSGNNVVLQAMPPMNYPTSNYTKHREFSERRESQENRGRGSTVTPDRSYNNNNNNQMHKKLELIKNVCESMLNEANSNGNSSEVLRNNLTPSPLYSEPRQSNTQYRNALSAVNVINNPSADVNPWNADPNFLATNTLQTQAFMLNTLNQCCQMLWLQQRELAALRNTVTMMMDRLPPLNSGVMDSGMASSTSYMNATPSFTPTPTMQDSRPIPPQPVHPIHQQSSFTKSNLSHLHQYPPAVSSATSMPNLAATQMPVIVPHLNHLQQQQQEVNACSNSSGVRVETNPNNVNVCNNLPIWNSSAGQALNNQVAPGNRANNYWDNFRSYSRQNLLSTKSNDGVDHHIHHHHNVVDRSNSFGLPSVTTPKRNTEHQDSGNASSIENTPRRRRACFATNKTNSTEGIDIVQNIPPDVLNVNQALRLDKHDERQPSSSSGRSRRDSSSRNLWQNNCLPASYSSELRDNIFRGVSNLIETNEDRPHFLLQLLRGLQKVKSDQMRCRTLQSIQALLTSSSNEEREHDAESLYSDYRDVLFRSPKNCESNHNDSLNSTALDIDFMLSEVLIYLNANSDQVFQYEFIEVIKDLLIQSRLSTVPKDEVLQRYFASLLECSIINYRGKVVEDVKINILKSIEDLLKMDLHKFVSRNEHHQQEIRVVRALSTDDDDEEEDDDVVNSHDNVGVSENMNINSNFEAISSSIVENNNPLSMLNGELAEADQSHLELLDEEEEGAVGGILNILIERPSNSNQQVDSNVEDGILTHPEDVEYSNEGLDRVPTRLPTSKSRSNTPNKDTCSRTDVNEQF